MDFSRYARQMVLYQIGEQGQRKLACSSLVVAGCGALGGVIATLLTRAGVGRIRLIDRDFIELNNLQRQILYDEDDVAAGMPKAAVAAEKLRRVSSQIEIEGVVADLNSSNAESLLSGFDLVLDAIDNFEARYLINDVCVKRSIPWIYGAVIGAYGVTMNILPEQAPCLRCLFPEPPAAGTVETCDVAGILGPIVTTIASVQATEAIKLLIGDATALSPGLLQVDLWDGEMQRTSVPRQADCPTCVQHDFVWLNAATTSQTTSLCGQDAIQIVMHTQQRLDLNELAERLASCGVVTVNPFMLRLQLPDHELNIFPDARAIIKGTTDESVARTLYARYIGL